MEQQVVLRSHEMQRAEARLGRSLDAVLTEWYLDEELTLDEIGERLGITKGAVSRWMAAFGIQRRRGGPRKAA